MTGEREYSVDRYGRPSLRDGIEIIPGYDGNVLLFNSEEGSYFRVSETVARVIPLFNGARSVHEIAEMLAGDQTSVQQVEASLQVLVDRLGETGVIEGVPRLKDPSVKSWFARMPIKRFPLLGSKGAAVMIRPLTVVLDALKLPFPLLMGICVFSICSGITLGILVVRENVVQSPQILIVSLGLFLLTTFLHECAHAVVCHLAGYPVRSLGLALWYYFIPIAYVDRTDTYRVQSRVKRITICLAGPASDMMLCAIISLCIWANWVQLSNLWGQVLVGYLFFLLVAMVGNFNPLVPSDGQQALESALGLVNGRNQAIGYFLSKLPGGSVVQPRQAISRSSHWGYLMYGAACCLYIVFLICVMFWSIGTVVSTVLVGVHVA